MSKQEKKMQRLKMAQAKQAAWKKRHTKENLHQNDEATSKRLEIRTNIKYELLSYIMLGMLQRGLYWTVTHLLANGNISCFVQGRSRCFSGSVRASTRA